MTLDTVFPPPRHYPQKEKHLAPNVDLEGFKFELIFDSEVEGERLDGMYGKSKGCLEEEIGEVSDDETFKDDGKEVRLEEFS